MSGLSIGGAYATTPFTLGNLKVLVGTIGNCLFGSGGDLDLIGAGRGYCRRYLPCMFAVILGAFADPLVVFAIF